MREEDIRKREIFNRYLEMVVKDIEEFFVFESFIKISCPVCNNDKNVYEFKKYGFNYVSCQSCLTLFVNPRPPFDILKRFYSESISTSFFVNEFFKPVVEARRKRIFKPRAEYISKILCNDKRLVIGDIGAGFGLFLEELKTILPNHQYIAIEPSAEMAEICQKKELIINCSVLEEMDGFESAFDLLTAFELIEHLFDPIVFFKKVHSLLKEGGFLFLTTLNGKGFDILSLWDKSKSVFPPHHLNFFNTNSIRLLLENVGFELVDISTPGKLDWDIVEGMIKNEGVNLGRFWKLIAEESSEECRIKLQDWISKYGYSSHMRILARK